MKKKLVKTLDIDPSPDETVWIRKCISFCFCIFNSGLQIRVEKRYWKTIFFILIQNICCGYSKEPSQWDGFLSTQNTCLNWWVRKYLQFYANKISLSGSILMMLIIFQLYFLVCYCHFHQYIYSTKEVPSYIICTCKIIISIANWYKSWINGPYSIRHVRTAHNLSYFRKTRNETIPENL